MTQFILSNGQALSIREAKPEDAAKLIAYVKQIADETHFLTFGSDEFQISEAQEASLLKNYAETENRIFFVALLDQQIVGILNIFASGKKRLRHIGELGVSVAKAHWNKGIGRKLLQVALQWAETNPLIRKIDLGVQADNHAAIHLYEDLGFRREGLQSRGSLIEGQFYDVVLMGKSFD
ncbi:MAG: GNAT family protein [Bacteroidota bacterium]